MTDGTPPLPICSWYWSWIACRRLSSYDATLVADRVALRKRAGQRRLELRPGRAGRGRQPLHERRRRVVVVVDEAAARTTRTATGTPSRLGRRSASPAPSSDPERCRTRPRRSRRRAAPLPWRRPRRSRTGCRRAASGRACRWPAPSPSGSAQCRYRRRPRSTRRPGRASGAAGRRSA